MTHKIVARGSPALGAAARDSFVARSLREVGGGRAAPSRLKNYR